MLQPSNKQLTAWASLSRRKGRREHKRFRIEGLRTVQQVLENKVLKVEAVVVRENEGQLLLTLPPTQGTIYEMKAADFKRICDTETPQGIFAICEISEPAVPDEILNVSGPVLFLDRINDPGNLGTIYRTAAWFGFKAVLMTKGTVDLFHPKVVRSTAGATAAIPFVYDASEGLLHRFYENGWNTLLTTLDDSSIDIHTITPTRKTVIVIGSESEGIAPGLMRPEYQPVHITGTADTKVESLNAAVSAAIVMHHFFQA